MDNDQLLTIYNKAQALFEKAKNPDVARFTLDNDVIALMHSIHNIPPESASSGLAIFTREIFAKTVEMLQPRCDGIQFSRRSAPPSQFSSRTLSRNADMPKALGTTDSDATGHGMEPRTVELAC